MPGHWSQQITNWLDAVAVQTEAALLDFSEGVVTCLDSLSEVAEQQAETLIDDLDREISPWLEQYFQPLLDAPLEVELEQAIEAIMRPWRQTIEPPLNQHPICTGCQHYHGEFYAGQMLVCGMYPYGPAADQIHCIDKVEVDWQEPWKSWLQQD